MVIILYKLQNQKVREYIILYYDLVKNVDFLIIQKTIYIYIYI